MKILIPLLAIISLLSLRAPAGDSLPFPVTLGGQAAEEGVPFAKVAKPVAADAEFEITTKPEMIIINLNKAAADGTPEQGATPAVIVLQGETKGKLSATMDKRKLEPGHYLMSIVAAGNTATIRFQVK